MRAEHVAIVGAGIGGLAAASLLASRGIAVTVAERGAEPGGKMRRIEIAGRAIDCGPTVFTMRSVFETIFAEAGSSLAEHLTLHPAEVLARHAWSEDERLDLFGDIDRSAAAIGRFAGPKDARGYREFCRRARRIYEALEGPFINAPRPSLNGLIGAFGMRRLGDLWRISPFVSLWNAIGEHFQDQRLRQLFGRYATYCGSSPFSAPATLMLVAHVEREGVWLIEGGMHRLAQALAALAARAGAVLRCNSEVSRLIVENGRCCGVTLASGERINADAVIVNADPAALGAGNFGRSAAAVPPVPKSSRSLSAITWAMAAPAHGFPLVRHNVFFSRDYADEFECLRRGKLPAEPTVYVCAQDRKDADIPCGTAAAPTEALLCLVNAPPNGDDNRLEQSEIIQCEERTFALLRRCGLHIERQPATTMVTTPRDFERLFPATGGALYGPASNGWMASFRRHGSRTRTPGLYLAGGSTHPGPGVPMAAISGRLAAEAIVGDFVSMRRSPTTGTPGGISTR